MQAPIPPDLAALADRIDRLVLYAERENRRRIAALEHRVAELEASRTPWYSRLYVRLAARSAT